MQKLIESKTLDLIKDLISKNEYKLSSNSNTPLSVLDLILKLLVWNHGTEELADLLENIDRFDAANILRKIGEWRVPCRVRKTTLAPNDSISLGKFDDAGATVMLDDSLLPRNYWIIVAANSTPSAPQHIPINLQQDVNQALYDPGDRWVFNNEDSIRNDASSFFNDIESTVNTIHVVKTSFLSISGINLGPYPDGAEIYVGFPTEGVLDYPDWFLNNDFQDIGYVDIVDQAKKIGGALGGISATLKTGGSQSEIKLPLFTSPFLGSTSVHFNIPSTLVQALGITFIANIDNIHWRPSSNSGSLDVRFTEVNGKPALELNILLDTSSNDEIEVIDGPDKNITELSVSLNFIMETREGRLHWLFESNANVKLEGSNTDEQEKSIAETVENTISDMLKPHLIEQFCLWFFSIPALRVAPPNWNGNESFEQHISNQNGVLQIANALFDVIGNNNDGIIRNPDYPTSL
ncbi:MAG: hypothetical protein R3220_07715, partial [Balneolaceae bacterium]|nr:hypothetical protein [Balneolaceae bacterium]